MLLSFEDFYHCVTGHRPFTWQTRLAQEVETGAWPSYIALPTAAGKTSIVEIWLYALARSIHQGLISRAVPIRLIWVVDRRIVVDSVADRARHLATSLREAETTSDNPLFEVAIALRKLGGSVPLVVSQLRGGIVGQRQWVTMPHQPTILSSTVDQVGSRLLFRGYGVSPYQFSLEAGLLACDTLLVIDEAHLSQPFVATLAKIEHFQAKATQNIAPALQSVVVSATLPHELEARASAFTLQQDERAELAVRLAHPKLATLIPAAKTPSFVERIAAAAHSLIGTHTGDVTAVIVNRVDTARKIYSLLTIDYETLLLTGRIRPYDRDALLDTWLPQLSAGRSRETELLPRVIVATQTIEVGADLDFDTMATEMATFSALRQRFGRLNRLGTQNQAAAMIVQREKSEGAYPYDEQVVKQVWEWLSAHASPSQNGASAIIDMSDEAIVALLASGDVPPEMATIEAPILARTHLEQWSQTSLRPDSDPDIGPFLHGKEHLSPSEVNLVWRADLLERDLIYAYQHLELRAMIERLLTAQIDLAPPRIEEALSLPVWTVRQWLMNGYAKDTISDLEGTTEPQEDRTTTQTLIRYALQWDGDDATLIYSPEQISPGNTIVVPAAYGGMDMFGWLPESIEPVSDIGDFAGWKGRSRQHVRLHPLVLPSLLKASEDLEPWVTALGAMLDELDAENYLESGATHNSFGEQLLEYVEALLPHLNQETSEMLASWLTSKRQWIPYPRADSAFLTRPLGIILTWVTSRNGIRLAVGSTSDEENQSSMVGIGRLPVLYPVTLEDHSEAVARYSRDWASLCGLPNDIVQTLDWAGRLHDIGKCEPRFQMMLRGGHEPTVFDEPLAKSGMDPNDRVLQDYARRQARLPKYLRHEAISARLLLNSHSQLPTEIERDLLCYLVGTHHGRGRPWFPVVADSNPTTVSATIAGNTVAASSATNLERIDGGWPDLFAMLQSRYGYWGLAYLESILRLADHWVSAQEVPYE